MNGYKGSMSILVCGRKCFDLPREVHLGSLFFDIHLEKVVSFFLIKGVDTL